MNYHQQSFVQNGYFYPGTIFYPGSQQQQAANAQHLQAQYAAAHIANVSYPANQVNTEANVAVTDAYSAYASGTNSCSYPSHPSSASTSSYNNAFQKAASDWPVEHRGIHRPVNIFSDAELYRHKRQLRKSARPTAKNYYCDLCRISCIGDEPWTQHVAGRAHKQRERELNTTITLEVDADGRMVAKAASNPSNATAGLAISAYAKSAVTSAQAQVSSNNAVGKTHASSLHCEVCEVSCIGKHLFLMHIHGQKHLKRLKLYQQLGKTVPASLEDTLRRLGVEKLAAPLRDSAVRSNPLAQQIEVAANRFVPGTTLKSVGSKSAASAKERRFEADYAELQAMVEPKRSKVEEARPSSPGLKLPSWLMAPSSSSSTPQLGANESPVPVSVHSQAEKRASAAAPNGNSSSTTALPSATQKSDLIVGQLIMESRERRIASLERAMRQTPVGEEYLVEKYNQFGAFVSFFCKLCECDLTDLGGKMAHLRGKRHRLNYRDIVDPKLPVNLSWFEYKRLRPDSSSSHVKNSRTDEHDEVLLANKFFEADAVEPLVQIPLSVALQQPIGFGMPAVTTSVPLANALATTTRLDRMILLKQRELAHAEGESNALLRLVRVVEQALQAVSTVVASASSVANAGVCGLKGVMRVGDFANRTLIRRRTDDGGCSSLEAHLVVLASDWPTRKLLSLVFDQLPDVLHKLLKQDKDGDLEEVHVRLDSASASIEIRSLIAPFARCVVHLTSSATRDANRSDQVDDDPRLDGSLCAHWLTETRRTKWFEARIAPSVLCLQVLRVLLELAGRRAELNGMTSWCWQLFLFRCFELAQSVHGANISPSIVMRTVFASLASGVLLPTAFDGPAFGGRKFAIRDPCERDERDAFAVVDEQTRERVTSFAQFALRMWTLQRADELLAVRFDISQFDRRDKLIEATKNTKPNAEQTEPAGSNVAEKASSSHEHEQSMDSDSSFPIDDNNVFVSSKVVRRASKLSSE